MPPLPSPPPLPADFIGVSGYAPLIRPLSQGAMEISWETAGYEFGLFNISLKDLAAKGKKLVFRRARLTMPHGHARGLVRVRARPRLVAAA